MARKRRKRRRLIPGLGSLRSRRPRLPGWRAREPVLESAPVDLEPVERKVAQVGDAVQALGDRVDGLAKKKSPVPVDYEPDIQRLGDAVLALGDRVDQEARREG